MDAGLAPYALSSQEGEALWFFGILTTFKATAEQTGGHFALVEQLAPRGLATPLHVEHEDDEAFYVLEGELTFYFEDGPPIQASAGSFVYLAAGTPHAFEVNSDSARFLNFTTPQHEAFMRTAGEPAQRRVVPEVPPDMDKVMAAAQRYGVEVVGPPPGEQTGIE